MAEFTHIEWCHHTFNGWRGCTKVSRGCTNCYADTLSARNPGVLGIWGPKGTRVVASESMWRLPLKWDRAAKEAGQRHRVFCASLADVFEDWDGPMVDSQGNRLRVDPRGWYADSPCDREPGPLVTMDDCRARLFDLILATPNLDWLLLTKRPEIMRDYLVSKMFGGLAHEWGDGWPNVWLGTTVEDSEARKRIKVLLSIPGAVHWISGEPLLEAVNIEDYLYQLQTRSRQPWPHGRLDWVICGGESGSKRSFDLCWARSLRDQCRQAGVAFFMKQMGANPIETIRPGLPDFQTINLKDSHGGDWSEWPEDLRVREFPTPALAAIGGPP